MKKPFSIAMFVLFSLSIAPLAVAQSTAAAKAARLQRLQQQQAAVLARAKAAQAAGTATAAPTAPTAVVTPPPPPTAVATAPTATATAVATAAPKASASAAASAKPATSASAAPASASAAPASAAPSALEIESLRKSRPERRHAEVVDLQSRWGSLLADPRSAEELKLHAQRFAYLQRIRALGAKDPTFVKGVDALLTKEESRDADALNALRSGALPAAAAPATPPAVAAPTTPPAPTPANGASK